jgi:ubiquinone/menaquinone biosynthesis C-methylase UbiE
MNRRSSFYMATLDKHLKSRDASILVVAGGETDRVVFQDLGFSDVTISNVDERVSGNEFEPFKWSYQDAENLSFEDETFDYVVVHAGLHHCYSPHRAMLEMYRVARHGIIIFESRDSLIMRFTIALGLTQMYEHAAVYYNSCQFGGVQNTDIPNYVYRWTERDIEKTIHCYAPYAPVHFLYSYGNDLPATAELSKSGDYKMLLVHVLRPFYFVFSFLFPKQQNLFSCFIEKPDLQTDHFEWLAFEDGKLRFNRTWGDDYYYKAKRS